MLNVGSKVKSGNGFCCRAGQGSRNRTYAEPGGGPSVSGETVETPEHFAGQAQSVLNHLGSTHAM